MSRADDDPTLATESTPLQYSHRSFSAPFRVSQVYSSNGSPVDEDPPVSRRAAVVRAIGLFLLCVFLYITALSVWSKPKQGLGKKTEMELALQRIMDDTLGNPIVYDRLAEMTDLYGPRPAGSDALEKSLDWMITHMREDGLNVRTENVTVDYWHRGSESLTLILPSRAPLDVPLLGLGGSVSTPEQGILADVVVVQDMDHLAQLGRDKLKGKVVLFNYAWRNYGQAVKYRRFGAIEAEAYGALAVLVRSVAPFSLSTPHTGLMAPSKIPAAAISIEDADLIQRIYHRNLNATNSKSPYRDAFAVPRVHLTMSSRMEMGRETRNVIAELRGRTKPDEVVLVGGHIDSWDVGSGAVDDGDGVFVAWHALRAMARQGQPPQRTVRMVAWAAEETGGAGSRAYFAAHKHDHHVFALESDTGCFKPWGLTFSGSRDAGRHVIDIGQRYLSHMQAGNVMETRDAGEADIAPWCNQGVPCASFLPYDPITHASPLSDSLSGDAAVEAIKRLSESYLASAFNCLSSARYAALDDPRLVHIQSVRKDIDMERSSVTQLDHVYVLFVTQWFFAYIHEKSPIPHGDVACMLDVRSIIYVTKRMRMSFEEKRFEELNASIRCLSQLLRIIDSMRLSEEDNIREASDSLKGSLFYEKSTMDLVVQLCQDSRYQQTTYLVDLIGLAHALLKMLERYAAGKEHMFVRRGQFTRRKQRKADDEELIAHDVVSGDEQDRAAEQEKAKRTKEQLFKFDQLERAFARESIILNYCAALEHYSILEPWAIRHIVALFYRVFVKHRLQAVFYKRILNDPALRTTRQEHKELLEFVQHCLRQFFKAVQRYPLLFVEILFPKTRSECGMIQGVIEFGSKVDLAKQAAR